MTTLPRPAAKGPHPKPTTAAVLDHDALVAAVRQLMEPLAALSVAHGLPYDTVEDLLKSAFVSAARAAQPNADSRRLVSRISTVTGLNRREVTRLSQLDAGQAAPARSPATQVFTRWVADPHLMTRQGVPRPLPRQGPAPSFDTLARSVTTDVHPRSLLDELCRLGLARLEGDMVHLEQKSFVPAGDTVRMLGFLGSNVGDHLRGAVANVLSQKPPHLEQAVFADGLSAASVEEIGRAMRTQWQALMTATVPELHRLIDTDRADGGTADQRVRIGLYMYSEPVPAPVSTDAPATKRAPRAARKNQSPAHHDDNDS